MESILTNIDGHTLEVFYTTETDFVKMFGQYEMIEYVTSLELNNDQLKSLDNDTKFDVLVKFNLKYACKITRKIENTLN